jgi:putative FmdB family regulatory protein
MPTYEYRCRACGHVFEIVQKMSDDPLVICPECGGELRKVFAPPAIAFKGSGFYATDHGKKSKAAETSSSSSSSSKDSKKDGGSSSEGGSSSSKSSSEDSSTPAKKEGS